MKAFPAEMPKRLQPNHVAMLKPAIQTTISAGRRKSIAASGNAESIARPIISAPADMAALTARTAREKLSEPSPTTAANVAERMNKAKQSERWKGMPIEVRRGWAGHCAF